MQANAAFLLLVGSVGVSGWMSCPTGIARTSRVPVAQPCAALRRSAPLMADGADGEAENEEHWTSRDDSELAKYIGERSSSARCGRPDRVLSGLNDAWVLIFNAGRHDEGVYTLQGRTSRATAHVLAFEVTDDADRFAELLQAEGFDLATPLNWDVRQLSAFCDAGEFEVSLVPQGGLVTPPAKNEYDLDAFERVAQEGQAPMTAGGVNDQYAAQRAAFERLFRDGPPSE